MVMVMVSEAVRFPNIGRLLSATFSFGARLGPFLVESVRAKQFCAPSQIAEDITPGPHFFERGTVCSCARVQFGYCLTAKKRSIPDEGTPNMLLELLSVRVNKIKEKGESGCGLFYGRISLVINNYLEHVYYSRKEEEADPVRPGFKLLLIGPDDFCIPVMDGDGVEFFLELFGNVALDTFHSDVAIQWPRGKYDKVLSSEFDSDDCSLTLTYIILEKAVQATVVITFTGVTRGVFRGEIWARAPEFGKHAVMLFQNKEDKLDVWPGQPLKLIRPVVAVSLGSSLMIDVEFGVLVGTVIFPAELSGSSTGELRANRAGIQVEVTWK